MNKLKKKNKYKTIGEVAKILNLVNEKKGTLSTYTIRFWKKNLNKLNQNFFQEKGDTTTKTQ